MNPRIADLAGKQFNRLTVLTSAGTRNGNMAWLCRCVCGTEKVILGFCVRNGNTKSCGCLNRELSKTKFVTHGKSGERIYNIWQDMIARCSNPRSNNFKNYGARGIRVCKRWKTFAAFYKDVGDAPPKHDLSRIDNDKGYCPKNVNWSTRRDNLRNTRRNKILTLGGVSLCQMEWSEKTGIGFNTLSWRISAGWSTRKTLTTPAKQYNRKQIA